MTETETPEEPIATKIEELEVDNYDPTEDGDDSTPPEDRPT